MWSVPFVSVFAVLTHFQAGLARYGLPQDETLPSIRKAQIDLVRAGFTYGPAVGGGPFYPSGVLGLAKAALDVAAGGVEVAAQTLIATQDSLSAMGDEDKYNGLASVEDYTLLYKGKWNETLPNGPAPGVLTNYSSDLFFSMERLSTNPFSLRRLAPGTPLPFAVDNATARNITGATTADLLAAGRLFYIDHSDHAHLEKTEGRYGGACSGYFYIAATGEFLPLAIRTNVGADLIYTPADPPADWLLAKILFNINDFFYHQAWHLAATHEVIQITWMAALRTLSVNHPVHGLLNRLTYAVFSINPLAATLLFADGAFFDHLLPFTGAAAQAYHTDLYFNGSGAFQAGYFEAELAARGLLDAHTGPALAHFPYHADARVIHDALHAFVADFVASFYATDALVHADAELQAWAAEANGPAHAIDFPAAITSAAQLVDMLTHLAHLGSTVHHAVNTNELLSLSATLPMHPGAVYKPLPTAKGVASVADFLPPLKSALLQFELDALFARPLLANTNRTLLNMFNDEDFLSQTNGATRNAAAAFTSTMAAFSATVKARTFDADGLSQGMPFVWQALDPAVAPISVTI